MLPKTGNDLHRAGVGDDIGGLLADALRLELGATHQAVKTVMQWTGASERSVKHWMAGTHAPRVAHLLALMRHSDGVLGRVLVAADRSDVLLAVEVAALRMKLIELLELLDALLPTPSAGEKIDGA